ncbi:Transcription factor BOA15 [Fulvia fulva]|nr:Transcription factor BOA15 [Fulvia fulva]WPV13725.1 Transcription factor BOA15 [Fulvia fulva]
MSSLREQLEYQQSLSPQHGYQPHPQQQQQPQHLAPANLAPQACSSCRKQKRKCDKQIPQCGLCLRIGRACDYSADAPPPMPSADDFEALRQKVMDLEGLLSRAVNTPNSGLSNGSSGGVNMSNGSSSLSNGQSPANVLALSPAPPPGPWPGPTTFPSMFFLDSDAFEYDRFHVQMPYVKVPPGALTALGSSAELREMIELYFATIHTYMPIISKIRLYQHLSSPMHEPGAEIALPFLAMKLVTSEVPEGASPICSKARYGLVESVTLLFSPKKLSIQNLNLHEKGAPQMLPRPNTWTEQEERRRVWWSVIVLDRFVNIGHRSKPFASSDPSLDAILPTDDSSWDQGQMLVAAPLALSASQTIRAAPFARTCQASHLLGKVVRHVNEKNLPADYRFTEALQLHRTLQALSSVLPDEAAEDDPTHKPTLCTSMAVCYSALLTLYDAYSCTEKRLENGPEEQLVMQKEAIDGLSAVSAEVVHLARRVRGFIEKAGLGRVSPLVIDSLYQAAANYAWYVRESSRPECHERLQEIKEVLVLLDRRWKVAGQYLFHVSEFWDSLNTNNNH